MFTVNSNTRAMTQSEGRRDVEKRILGVVKSVLKSSMFLALAAAAVLTFVAASATTAQAQSRAYWATNGCYYQDNGYGYQAIECRSYDRSLGTWVARNSNGTFYLFQGRWYDQQNYMLVLLQEVARQDQARARRNQALINRSNVNASNNLTLINQMRQNQQNMRIANSPR